MPTTEREFHALFLKAGEARRWTGKLAGLFPTLAREARAADPTGHAERAVDKDWHWRVLPAGAVVGVRVRSDMDGRYELRIARGEPLEGKEARKKFEVEISTFLRHFELVELDGSTPAEDQSACYVRLPADVRDKGKTAARFIQLRRGEVRPGEPLPPVSDGGPGDAGGMVSERGPGAAVPASLGGSESGVHGGNQEEARPSVKDKRHVWFDLEATGLDPHTDRIVEIAILELPSGQTYHSLVNPGVPIPAEVTEIHGISDDDVKDAPTFGAIAEAIQASVTDAVLCHFNGRRYDTVLLDAELRRAGRPGLPRDEIGRIVLPEIDLYRIWFQAEERSLVAAAKRFAGVDLENAHSAEADTDVLPKILAGMAAEFGFDANDADALVKLSCPEDEVDRSGKFRKENGVAVFNFGKHKDQPVRENLDYVGWMLTADFPEETKAVGRYLIRHFEKKAGGQTSMGV